jgi:hypothetical protein
MRKGDAMDQPQGQAPAGDVGQLLVETDKNLAMIAKAAGSADQMPDDLKEGFQQVSDMFRSLLDKALKTGGGEEAAEGESGPQPMQGTGTPEAGGNPNARPVSMGG